MQQWLCAIHSEKQMYMGLTNSLDTSCAYLVQYYFNTKITNVQQCTYNKNLNCWKIKGHISGPIQNVVVTFL